MPQLRRVVLGFNPDRAAQAVSPAMLVEYHGKPKKAIRSEHLSFWGLLVGNNAVIICPFSSPMWPLECSESLCSDMQSLRLSELCSAYTTNSTASAGGGPPTVSTL